MVGRKKYGGEFAAVRGSRSFAGLEFGPFLRSGTYEPGLPIGASGRLVGSCVRIFRSILSRGIDCEAGCCRRGLQREGNRWRTQGPCDNLPVHLFPEVSESRINAGFF